MQTADKITPGQRWISEMEPELGLGIVTGVEKRRISIHFPAGECFRQYAIETAPLKRVLFQQGDTIKTKAGNTMVVKSIREKDGLFYYIGDKDEISETDLCDAISFTTPKERLFNGQTDPSYVFDLRYNARLFRSTVSKSPVRGFLGGRIDLLSHQITIASATASRPIPRVLLADEVGLGKTIEACLIIHRLLLTGRIQRILICVPEHLIHQWFVELLRKFNLKFRIFDEHYCRSLEQHHPDSNPFLDDQLILSDINFIAGTEERKQQAIDGKWDMLVIDEAHHLKKGSRTYQFAEAASKHTNGVVLLTATPEQMGLHTHFDRLHLLDPDRYFDFDRFQKENNHYQHIATVAENILNKKEPDLKGKKILISLFPEEKETIEKDWNEWVQNPEKSRKRIENLLDRYGTGRVMFRNTRHALNAFPERAIHIIPLSGADKIKKQLEAEFKNDLKLHTERRHEDYSQDPRIEWLSDFLKKNRNKKILLICNSIEKTKAIQTAIRIRLNVKTALFHEEMTIIQRDRNAAWFAEKEGAQILICSEIGSEGRNFQFSQHLILFDLPINPELLEQRIGRLDRIGQQKKIHIYIPFVEGTPQEILINWYHLGVRAFEKIVPGAGQIVENFKDKILDLAFRWPAEGIALDTELKNLIKNTQKTTHEIVKKMETGRNRLLELNSCKPQDAERYINEIKKWDTDQSLDRFMLRALDFLGIYAEELGYRTFALRPVNLRIDGIPGFNENGMNVTFDRSVAMKREDIHFMTWDHPLVTGLVDVLTGTEMGNSSVAIWNNMEEHYLIECIFVVECIAPPKLNIERFLPATPIRIVMDPSFTDCTEQYPCAAINQNLKNDQPQKIFEFEFFSRDRLEKMIQNARETVETIIPKMIDQSIGEMETIVKNEIQRLRYLQKINPNVKQKEIDLFLQEKELLKNYISSAQVRLDAMRLIWHGGATTF